MFRDRKGAKLMLMGAYIVLATLLCIVLYCGTFFDQVLYPLKNPSQGGFFSLVFQILNIYDSIVNRSLVPVVHVGVGRGKDVQVVHVLHLAGVEHVLYLRHLRVGHVAPPDHP